MAVTHFFDKLKDHSAHILLVNSFQSSQLACIKALHRLGFSQIKICRGISDLQQHLRWNRIDWVIIALSDGMAFPAMQLLRNFYKKDQHRIRFSFIYREKDQFAMPEAFQSGLLNSMPIGRFMDFDNALAEFRDFINACQEHSLKGHHEAYIAADSLRRCLRQTNNWDELLKLERGMVEAFPNDMQNMFRLVEAHFEAGEMSKGRELLAELEQASPNFPGVNELLDRHPAAKASADKRIGVRLDMRNVMIIEHDEVEYGILETALKRLGIQNCLHYSSYQEAWQAIKKGAPVDLIIAEWQNQNQKFGATAFFQRVRAQEDLAFLPLCLLASKLSPEEAQLATDLNVSQILAKPLREDHTALAISYALEQYRRPTERRPVEMKIVQALHEGHKSFAYHLRQHFLAQPTIALSRKYYVEAIFLYHHKSFTKAKNHLIKGIELANKQSSKSIRINVDKIFLLAQCLINLGNRPLALQILQKASSLSPHNIRMHLAIAETLHALGQSREAEVAFRKAEAIDAEHIHVMIMGTELGIAGSDDPSIQGKRIEEIVSILNNQAVSLIQKDQGSKAIDVYKSALKMLAESGHPHVGTLHYNLALAYLRMGARVEARIHLEDARRTAQDKIQKRADKLIQKLKANPQYEPPLKAELNGSAYISPLAYWKVASLKPSIALYGIYRSEEEDFKILAVS